MHVFSEKLLKFREKIIEINSFAEIRLRLPESGRLIDYNNRLSNNR